MGAEIRTSLNNRARPIPSLGTVLPGGLHEQSFALPSRLLTVSEVAKWLCVSPTWVRDHASGRRRPKLPSIKLGKALRFRAENVEEFIRSCQQ